MFNIDKIINAQFGETKSTIRSSVKKIVKSGEFGTETVIGDISLDIDGSITSAERVMIETLLTAQIEYGIWDKLAVRGFVRQDEFATRVSLIEAYVNQMASKFASITGQDAEEVFASYTAQIKERATQHIETVAETGKSAQNGSQTASTGQGQTTTAQSGLTAGTGVKDVAGATGVASSATTGRVGVDTPPFNVNNGATAQATTQAQPVHGTQPMQNAQTQTATQPVNTQGATAPVNAQTGMGQAVPNATQGTAQPNYTQPAQQNAQPVQQNAQANAQQTYNQQGYMNGQYAQQAQPVQNTQPAQAQQGQSAQAQQGYANYGNQAYNQQNYAQQGYAQAQPQQGYSGQPNYQQGQPYNYGQNR